MGKGKGRSNDLLREHVGEESHKLHGFSAIGSGADVAMSQLMLLGQKRSSTLADTLYCVAAAKFASEHSNGLGVGERTSMHVSWKRGETDPKGEVVVQRISEAEVASLRAIWNEQGVREFRSTQHVMPQTSLPE